MTYHDSIRPSLPDDMIVTIRLTPIGLQQLREGMECKYVRLDALPEHVLAPGETAVYDIYTETVQQIDAIPAWEAPHSPGFVPAEDHRG